MRVYRSFFCLVLSLVSVMAWAAPDPETRIKNSNRVLDEVMQTPEHRIPQRMLRDAYAVAVIPDVVKAGLIVGGRRGSGVIAVRGADGACSKPSLLTLTGGSIGFQAGVQSTDVVLVFRSQRGVDSIVNGKFTLGADASVAAGPVGRTAQAATDAELKAEIYSYSRARGLFAGVALDGAVLAIDHRANQSTYGRNVTPRAIFEGRVSSSPAVAVDLRDRLEEYSQP